MKNHFHLLIVGLLFISTLSIAQKPPVKFGKIDEELVKMISHPLDPDADAMVLIDYGSTRFRYDDEKGFLFEFEKIIRIKVFTKDGLDYGDFMVPYYEDGSLKEDVMTVKGATYNLENGSVTKSKLTKSSIFHEEETKRWRSVKVSMPDVKEGSLIELTYKKVSPFIWNLATWEFQDDIPTVHSEYKVIIPEYFDYQLLFSGYQPMVVSEKSSTSGSIVIQSKSRTVYDRTVKTSFETDKYDYRATKYRWVAKDVPSFKPEAYIASANDYISKVRFELRGTQYPNRAYKQYMGTWKTLNNSFLEHTRFGVAITGAAFMKDELDAISSLGNDIDKIAGVVNIVKNQVEWNEIYSRYVNNTLRRAWMERKGNSADINMIIVAGLRKLGYNADPVLISTRGHGMIRDQYAISSQFNSVVACVKLGDKEILLDGTDKYLPVGVLPTSTLNGKGWKVSKISPGWVKLVPSTKQEQIFNTNLTIESAGGVSGTVELTAKGYAGYASHKALKIKGEEKYFTDFQDNNKDWSIEDYEFNNDKGSAEPFNAKYSVEWNENLTASADLIYFNPTFGEIIEENPFKLEKREYPVDYGFPIRKEYNFNFKLPEGYVIEETPAPESLSMKGDAATFSYDISKENPGELIVKADFSINKTMFVQTEYSELKAFYNAMLKKCTEQVVLKKSSGQ